MESKLNKTNVKPVRTEKPSDEVNNNVTWKPGMKPKGGFQSVYSFGNGMGTTKPEPDRKVIKG